MEQNPAARSRASITSGSTRVRHGSTAAATRAAAEPGAGGPLVDASDRENVRTNSLPASSEATQAKIAFAEDQHPQAGHEDRLRRVQSGGL
ncbi:MAG: hypothetical protein ACLQBX_07990 [Candidatus Limnocylindrales bacterium]